MIFWNKLQKVLNYWPNSIHYYYYSYCTKGNNKLNYFCLMHKVSMNKCIV